MLVFDWLNVGNYYRGDAVTQNELIGEVIDLEELILKIHQVASLYPLQPKNDYERGVYTISRKICKMIREAKKL